MISGESGTTVVAPGAKTVGQAQILTEFSKPFELAGLFGAADAGAFVPQEVIIADDTRARGRDGGRRYVAAYTPEAIASAESWFRARARGEASQWVGLGGRTASGVGRVDGAEAETAQVPPLPNTLALLDHATEYATEFEGGTARRPRRPSSMLILVPPLTAPPHIYDGRWMSLKFTPTYLTLCFTRPTSTDGRR